MEDEGARTSDETPSIGVSASYPPISPPGSALAPTFKPVFARLALEISSRFARTRRLPVFWLHLGIPPREILEGGGDERSSTIDGDNTPKRVPQHFKKPGGCHRRYRLRSRRASPVHFQSRRRLLPGTLSLVPQIMTTSTCPVIAAGGIGDARRVVAALALGK